MADINACIDRNSDSSTRQRTNDDSKSEERQHDIDDWRVLGILIVRLEYHKTDIYNNGFLYPMYTQVSGYGLSHMSFITIAHTNGHFEAVGDSELSKRRRRLIIIPGSMM